MTAFTLFAHGSRLEEANDAVRRAAESLAASWGAPVEPSFLELAEPDLAGAVSRLAAAGASRIVVVPYFLTLGRHMQADLPRIVEGLRSIHTNVEIRIAEPLDGHPALLEALRDRAQQALERGNPAAGKVD